jgi:hypothetical protein
MRRVELFVVGEVISDGLVALACSLLEATTIRNFDYPSPTQPLLNPDYRALPAAQPRSGLLFETME